MARSSISIAMCTYNGAHYVQEQLDSIAAQTRLPDELVVCDDRSTDGTAGILGTFASGARFPVRMCFNEQNLGSTKNFEKAISHCGGDIIVLADQDDVWRPEKLECIEKVLSNSPRIGAVFTDAELVDLALRPMGRFLWQAVGFTRRKHQQAREGRAFEILIKRNVVTGATMAFRAEYNDLIIPIPEIWVHDRWIALLIAGVADLGIIQDPLISYRQHSENQIGLLKRKKKAPRAFSEVCWDRVKRFTNVRDRLLTVRNRTSVTEKAISDLEGLIRHLKVRAELPRSRWRRLPIAMRELLTLRYHRYGKGTRSFGRDLFRTVPRIVGAL